MSCVGSFVRSAPGERRPPARLDEAHQRPHRRRLADAVATEHRGHAALRHAERDALEHVRLARGRRAGPRPRAAAPSSQRLPEVRGLHRLVAEDALGRVARRAGGPWCMTAIRSATPVTTEMWCSTMSTVLPVLLLHGLDQLDERRDVLDAHPGHRLVEHDHPRVAASTMASSSLRLSPCASAPAGTAPASPAPRGPSAQRARSTALRTPSARRQIRIVPPRAASAASRAFSKTVSRGNTLEIWNVRPSPAAARRYGASSVTSRPSSVDRPRGRPVQARQEVEQRRLAGAVRPDDAEKLALGHLERDIGDDRRAADVKPEVPSREKRLGAHPREACANRWGRASPEASGCPARSASRAPASACRSAG